MAAVAMDFTRTVSVSITTAGLFALGMLYPHEQVACEVVVGQQNVHTAAAYADPNGGQVQLICVASGPQALHMLARGSDGLYYDPARVFVITIGVIQHCRHLSSTVAMNLSAYG